MRRILSTAALLAAFLISASCGVTRLPAGGTLGGRLHCTAPEFLKPSDKVAIIAPAYYTPMENVTGAAGVLQSWGYEPVVGANVGKKVAGQYAGTVEERAADLRWALEDPEIKAIICTRGGYGTIHLIDHFKAEDFSRHPKWLVGYSDITTLLEMENCSGVMGIHGTMGNTIAKGVEDTTCLTLKNLLAGKVPQYNLPAHQQNRYGQATGVLVGGNICTFVPNLDTWADATSRDGIILFIEEVGEAMHNIDRLFNMLRMRGVLERCNGIILGQFTGCDSEFDYGSVEAMLNTYLKDYNIPVLCGFPAGHDDPNLPLIMGAPVTIKVTPEGSEIRFNL